MHPNEIRSVDQMSALERAEHEGWLHCECNHEQQYDDPALEAAYRAGQARGLREEEEWAVGIRTSRYA